MGGKEDIAFDEGSFAFDAAPEGRPFDSSSGMKRVYRGTYRSRMAGEEIPAVAVFNHPDGDIFLSREHWALGVGEHDGFGPRLLAHATMPLPDDEGGRPFVVAIEDDAGISLADALEGSTLPGIAPLKLCPAGSSEGEAQTAKILYDITCQVRNMHHSGIYHHDLKSANVCLKSVGDDPWDIRATIIDFDHAAHDSDGGSVQSTPAYFDLLFDAIPRSKGCERSVVPTSRERDLGCLALLWCEVASRKALVYNRRKGGWSLGLDDLAQAFEGRPSPFFWYGNDGIPQARPLDNISDLEPLAASARLADADALAVALPIREEASLFRNGRYFDKESIRALESGYRTYLGKVEGSIARAIFENYNAHRLRDGVPVEYPDFETQPIDLRLSNHAQAANIVTLVWRLECEIVADERCDRDDVLERFDDEQIEALARWEHERYLEERRKRGWTYGETSDGHSGPVARVSPSLVPYDSLDDRLKEFCRQPMREIIDILRSQGLAVRKRSE